MGHRSGSLRFKPELILEQVDYLESLRFEVDGVAETHDSVARLTRSALESIALGSTGVDFLDSAVRRLGAVEADFISSGGQLADFAVKLAAAKELATEILGRLRSALIDLLDVENRIDILESEYKKKAVVDGMWGVGWMEERLNGDLRGIREHIDVLERTADTHVNRIRSLEDEWGTRLARLLMGNSSDPRRLSSQLSETVIERTTDGVVTSLWGSDGTIGANDVNQFMIGDCYFASSAAALASTAEGRDFIRRMIKDNGDGTYTVTFSKGRSFTVDSDSWVNGRGGAVTSLIGVDGAMWYLVLEEAYAEMKGGYPVLDGGGHSADVFRDFGLDTSQYGETVPSVFGVRVFDQLDSLSIDELDTRLSRFADGGAATVSFQHEGSAWYDPGFHVFSVVKYDADTQVVTLRNPWGSDGFLVKGLPTAVVGVVGSGGTMTVQEGIEWMSDGYCRMSLETLRKVGIDITVVDVISDSAGGS